MRTFTLQALQKTSLSRPAGYLEDVLSLAQVDGDKVTLSSESYRLLAKKYRQPQGKAPGSGPGTELSRLLKKFGIEPTPTCSCRAKAAQMDAWGCDECSKPERIDEVVSVMRAEAEARGLPFLDLPARLLVKRAIANARRKEAAANAQRPPHHDRRQEMAPQVHDAQG
jgi:hypothetical protein